MITISYHIMIPVFTGKLILVLVIPLLCHDIIIYTVGHHSDSGYLIMISSYSSSDIIIVAFYDTGVGLCTRVGRVLHLIVLKQISLLIRTSCGI